jgi:hypothetical protein
MEQIKQASRSAEDFGCPELCCSRDSGKKKASRFGLAFSYFGDSKDWCGGGDLNPYALRR